MQLIFPSAASFSITRRGWKAEVATIHDAGMPVHAIPAFSSAISIYGVAEEAWWPGRPGDDRRRLLLWRWWRRAGAAQPGSLDDAGLPDLLAVEDLERSGGRRSNLHWHRALRPLSLLTTSSTSSERAFSETAFSFTVMQYQRSRRVRRE